MHVVMLQNLVQIRQYRRLEDGSLNAVTRGQQRFRLKRCWIDAEGVVRTWNTLHVIVKNKKNCGMESSFNFSFLLMSSSGLHFFRHLERCRLFRKICH